MPTVVVTTRFRDFGDNDQSYYADLKKKQREYIREQFPTATDLKQQVITHGIPDATSLGDLKSKNQVAIRNEFTLTEAEAAELKKGRRI